VSKLVERRRSASGDVLDGRIDQTCLSFPVEALQVEQGVRRPLGNAGREHGVPEISGRYIHIPDLAANGVGKLPRDLAVGQRLRSRQGVGLSLMTTFREHLHRHRRDVTEIDDADRSIRLRRVECPLCSDGVGVVGDEVLHESVRTQEGVGDACSLDPFLGIAVQAGERGLAATKRGQLDDVADARAHTRAKDAVLQVDEVRERRSDQEHPLDIVQRGADRLGLRILHEHGGHSGRRLPDFVGRLVRRPNPRAANHGYLPRHYLAEDARPLLHAYVADYLKDEVAAEGLTRNLPAFADFLCAAALADGQLVNYTTIARDCGVSAYTVREHFQILVDTGMRAAGEVWNAVDTRRLVLVVVLAPISK